jgi:hypothetical protein
MTANVRTWGFALALAVIAAGTIGFWSGRGTNRPTTLQAVAESRPTGPSELVKSLRQSRAEQIRQAGELLAWCEELRRAPEQVTPDDRRIVYHAVKLFGELRYVPAVSFLIAEGVEWKVGCIGPNWSDTWDEVPPFEETHPHLAALIEIGPPAVAPLVDEYVKQWKLVPNRDKEKVATVLPTLEGTLSDDSLLGATLVLIQKRLTKMSLVAGFVPEDRDELGALQHLKRELLKGLD